MAGLDPGFLVEGAVLGAGFLGGAAFFLGDARALAAAFRWAAVEADFLLEAAAAAAAAILAA